MTIRLFGFLLLSLVFLASAFNWHGVKIDRNELGLALMILLISLFSDLKEFNFWGLIGKKEGFRDLNKLEGKPSISENPPIADQTKVEQAEQQVPIQLMDTNTGNFLAISFEIERLLRIASNVLSAGQTAPTNPEKLIKVLHDKGLLTDTGVSQIKAIRWLRNIIAHGKINEITEKTLEQGIDLASGLYNELSNWLKNPS